MQRVEYHRVSRAFISDLRKSTARDAFNCLLAKLRYVVISVGIERIVERIRTRHPYLPISHSFERLRVDSSVLEKACDVRITHGRHKMSLAQ